MLGYVKIDKGELKLREYEVYTGYYCGICKSIGRRYGQLPRMSLSYDAAFLAILLASIGDERDVPVQEHCIGHHVKKKTIIRNDAVDYAADVMLILAWYKLIDDVNDEGKVYAKALRLLLRRLHKNLLTSYPALCDDIEGHLADLSRLEREKCASLDMVGEAFSKIMEVIFLEGVRRLYGESLFETHGTLPEGEVTKEKNDRPVLSIDKFQNEPISIAEAMARTGYHLGKWIYLMDAIDDIEENLETGAYNPLVYRYDYDQRSETPDTFKARIKSSLKFNLYQYLASIGNCVATLDIRKNQGIIDNVIYFGLNRKTEEILQGDRNESV